MVHTPETLLFIPPEEEGGAPMGAVVPKQADVARGVAERDEILAKHAHALGRPIRRGQLGRQERRQPVLAHQLAHRRPPPDAGQQRIVLFAEQSSSEAYVPLPSAQAAQGSR
jgi:hypothetical protein